MKIALNRDGTAKGTLTLTFEKAERQVMEAVFSASKDLYAVDIEELPEVLQRHWRGRLFSGRPASIPGADAASDDLAEARLGWRSERLVMLEKWLAPGAPFGEGGNGVLTLPPDEIDLFFSIINDRRLSLAALYLVTEDLMEADIEAIQPQELQQAVWEIHLLAFVMENCLQCIQEWKEEL
ncbi:hypothetical protein SAMN05444156_2271 [Verrucomicrobium sp. GAS474]|uniref:hypothetical protein n=1 Tax=Verrucomicrobium sp. GAS474 TaxID=1882831 RepID=UPI00087A87EF|nr:hypothetical protein [Verrucomicrobium sp. GAS474]SDU15209.1 hypothetical protein SAMN05444156_2271 [Verrucomicrobium sp. GAS474]